MLNYDTARMFICAAFCLTLSHIILNRFKNPPSATLALIAMMPLVPWVLTFLGTSTEKITRLAIPSIGIPGLLLFPVVCLGSFISLVLDKRKSTLVGESLVCLSVACVASVLGLVFLYLTLMDLP